MQYIFQNILLLSKRQSLCKKCTCDHLSNQVSSQPKNYVTICSRFLLGLEQYRIIQVIIVNATSQKNTSIVSHPEKAPIRALLILEFWVWAANPPEAIQASGSSPSAAAYPAVKKPEDPVGVSTLPSYTFAAATSPSPSPLMPVAD
eukprot:TRINITY_DN4943_c0_g1_i1.p3 TRINITY_DN4943_c0_g1~~TRINITY_DN4943_c0_g1_i1.p3  ORF type:complete len:146 (+),score=3.65 TRINITY_DN4943_c0_g1_i1:59-496(+)